MSWASVQTVYLDKLIRVQKKALRVVAGTKWNTHSAPLFKHNRILRANSLNKLQTACCMYKAIRRTLPKIFQNYYLLNTDVHKYNTRQSFNIHTFSARTRVRKFRIKHHGPNI